MADASADRERLRIFVISGSDLSYQDGGRTHLLEKWTRVAAARHEVDLWAFARERSPEWSLLNVRAPRHVPVPGVAGLSYTASLMASVLLHVRRRRPDAVHVRLSQHTAPVALILRRLTGVPVVLEVTGPIVEEARLYGVSERKVAVIRALATRAMRAADAVVAVTEGIKRQLVEEYGVAERAVHIVGNGVNAESFRPRPMAEARERIGVTTRGPVVGFVGNLHRWQGTEYLIAAARPIVESVPDVEIHIVGDGVTRDLLERSAAQLGVGDRVRFHGQVPYGDVPEFISACDVLVAPLVPKPTGDSGYSPLKLYEYLSSARPVVASRLEGLEVIERAHVGRLVPPADAEALALAVIELLDDPARAEMGERARRLAVEEFSWDRAAGRTIAIIESVARRA